MLQINLRRQLILPLLVLFSANGCLWQSDAPSQEQARSLELEETAEPEAEEPSEESSRPWYDVSAYGSFSEAPDIPLPGPQEAKALYVRGHYLVQAVAACGSCHATKPAVPNAPLAGGRQMRDRFGEVHAPNITPDKETGIGDWNIAEVMRAIRSAIDRDGQALSIELHEGYRWLADEDAKAIAVYLLAQRPVHREVPRRKLGGFERRRWGLISQHSEVKGYVPTVPDKPTHQYGRYLSDQVAGCKNCHTGADKLLSAAEPYSGTEKPKGSLLGRLVGLGKADQSKEEQDEVYALLSDAGREEWQTRHGDVLASGTDLSDSEVDLSFPVPGPDIRGNSETGLKDWTLTQITEYLFTGINPDGKQSNPLLCPWTYYRQMNLNDRMAIARYLKRL